MTAPNTSTMPTKPKDRGAATNVSQRDRRWTDTFFDDYRHHRFPNGRPFTGEREFKSGVSEQSVTAGFLTSDLQCGEYFCENPDQGQTATERQMTLASAWEAPFLLPGGKKYMQFNYAKNRITWRYDGYIADERAGLARFWEAAALIAGENDIIDPSRPMAVPARIRLKVGNPMTYLHKIRLAQACQAGDPWIMGAVNTPNEELVKLLGLGTVQYFGGVALGDTAHILVPAQREPAPLVTPEQVLSVPISQVQQMIADALAARDAADAAKKQEAKDRMAKVRDGKKPKAGANA